MTATPSAQNGHRVMDGQGAQTFVSVWGHSDAASAKIAELEAELAKAGAGGGGNPAYKAAVDALRWHWRRMRTGQDRAAVAHPAVAGEESG